MAEYIVYLSDDEYTEQFKWTAKELIRCKDCKWHWKSAEWHLKGYCENDKCWDGIHFETDNDFYCGYAERKEE